MRIEVANPDHRIKHEMYADVEIDAGAGEADALAVPVSAVIDSGNRQVVLVERGEGRFEPRAVKLGLRGDGYVEITRGPQGRREGRRRGQLPDRCREQSQGGAVGFADARRRREPPCSAAGEHKP